MYWVSILIHNMPVDPLKQTVSGDDSPLTVDYKIGDVVAYRNFYLDQLHVVDELYGDDSNEVGITGLNKRENWLKGFVDKGSIRFATKAEKKAKQRLED